MKHKLNNYTIRDLKIAYESPNFSIETVVSIECELLRREAANIAELNDALEAVRVHNLV